MATLTAADLQRRRQDLEGAPDPFPDLTNAARAQPTTSKDSAPRQPSHAALDTSSVQSFPALAPSAAPAQAKQLGTPPAWGNGPRFKPPAPRAAAATDSFTLDAIDLSAAGKDGKRASNLSEVIRNVNAKFKVKVEASNVAGETIFVLKADSTRDVENAKKALVSLLSPSVTLTVNAPASTIASIIGVKGAFLNHIRDETGARVEIPRRDVAATNGIHKDKDATATASGHDEEETVPITITAPGVYAAEAKRLILAQIATKTAKTTQRVHAISAHVLPFIAARTAEFEALATEGIATLTVADADAVATGDRAAVTQVLDGVRAAVAELEVALTNIKMPLPRRQHRLLSGKAADQIFAGARCAVVLPAADAQVDEIVLWSRPMDLPAALAAVQQAASSQHVHSFIIPGDGDVPLQTFTYLSRTGFNKTLIASHPAVTVHAPALASLSGSDKVTIDVVGDKPAVDAAVATLAEKTAALKGATRSVEIDWLIHGAIVGRFAKKIKGWADDQRVTLFFPPETAEVRHVLLVHDPMAGADGRAAALDGVQKDLLACAKELADLRTETMRVDPKWHSAILGKNGTTLNAIIGADSTLTIKLGADAARLTKTEGEADDLVAVRGAAEDVTHAIAEIARIVEQAKNDEIDNSHVTEFMIAREYVGRVVGSHGSAVNRLREQLGVDVDFLDEDDALVQDKDKVGPRKKKTSATGSTGGKSKVVIKGRKENVEEAKKRVLAQVEKLTDETFEVLKIPRAYHPALIGRGAKYVMRLEEKYGVKITFPREGDGDGEGRTREALKVDEVLIKGGKKGVAEAKKELVDAVEFEKESNNSVKFTVPTRSVARILGKGGAVINEIKDSSGATIDIDKGGAGDDGAVTHVTVRGTKAAVAEAKAAVLRIADEVGGEVAETVNVDARFHRALIGARGQGLRDMVVRCGGSADPKAQAGLVHFPRSGEPQDEIRLRGPAAIVKKLKAELEDTARQLADRVVLGVVVPAQSHRALIGRGGVALTTLERRHSVQVQFPGSRAYAGVGEPENAADLADADAADLVKVMGPRAGADAAITELLGNVKVPSAPAATAREREGGGAAAGQLSESVEVPLKYHHAISQGGAFFRGLRAYGVSVDHSATPQKSLPTRPPTAARIDEVPAGGSPEWQVMPNYSSVDDGIATWTLRAHEQSALEKARSALDDAVAAAAAASHVGFLTLTDRGVFPRIVGAKGANVARLRAETGADITVGREDSTIVLVGSMDQIEAAKKEIEQIANRPSRPRA